MLKQSARLATRDLLAVAESVSKFCRATGATALVKLGAPTADELGYAKSLAVQEIGGANVILLEQDASQGQVSPAVPPPVTAAAGILS